VTSAGRLGRPPLPPRSPSRSKYTCLVGLGLTFFGGALTPALRAAVDELVRLVVGDDPTQVEAIPARLRRAAGSAGPGGIFALALSAIDTMTPPTRSSRRPTSMAWCTY
jgi:hypothetical protein